MTAIWRFLCACFVLTFVLPGCAGDGDPGVDPRRNATEDPAQDEAASEAADTARFASSVQALGFRQADSALVAENGLTRMRAEFDTQGARIHHADRGYITSVAAVSLGRGATPSPLPARAPRLASCDQTECPNRLEIDRPGLTEWWDNGPAGLEQGFEVAARPDGAGPLLVDLSVEGLQGSVTGDGALAIFRDRGRVAMLVRDLHAFDATGAALGARFEAGDGRLTYVIEDAGAAYPIIIDPVFTFAETVLLGSGASELGTAVAVGDFNGDGYDDLAAGEPEHDDASGGLSVGRAQVFLGGQGGVAATSSWTRVGPNAYARLGTALVTGNFNGDAYDDLAIGVIYDNSGNLTYPGATQVFMGSANGLGAAPAVWYVGLDVSGYCGGTLAVGDINGDTYDDLIEACKEGHAPNNTSDPGRVNVYNGGPNGLPPSVASLSLYGASNEADFGDGLAVGDFNGDGSDDLAVGAHHEDGVGVIDAGWVGVYPGSANGISSVTTWTLTGTQTNGYLGSKLGAGDSNGDGYDDLLIGEENWNGGTSGQGRARLFMGAGLGLSQLPIAEALGTSSGDGLGGPYSVSGGVGGNTMVLADLNGDGFDDGVLGEPYANTNGTDSGRTRIAFGGATGPEPYFGFATTGSAASMLEGYAIGTGDFDGDGVVDLALGAPDSDTGGAQNGHVRVIPGPFGGATGSTTYQAPNPTSSTTGGTRSKGLFYQATTAGRLQSVSQRAGNGTGTVTFTVYESTSISSGYAQIAQSTGEASANSPWTSSTPMDVPLVAGRYYGVIASWSGALNYGWETSFAFPQVLPGFGDVIGNYTNESTATPPASPTPGAVGSSSSAYAQRLTIAPEVDADGDGSQAFADCQDGVGSNASGGTEVCDGLDNDCDGDADFGGLTFESHTGTSISTNATNIKGNLYDVTTPILVNSVEIFFNPQGGQALHVGVWTRASGSTTAFSLQRAVGLPTTGSAAAWWTADFPDLALGAGTEVLVGYQWGGQSGGYAFTSSNGSVPPWGTYAGRISGNGTVPNFPGDSYVPGEYTSGSYRIRINTSTEVDSDGDGDFACTDCDDTDNTSYTGATELCDGLDNDCDGSSAGEADGDGDQYRVCQNDCDDTDASINPAATEICDGVDTDCNASTTVAGDVDADGDNELACAGDCDDTNPAVNTSAAEACDGVDTDCAGGVVSQYVSPVGTGTSSAANYFRGGRYTMSTSLTLNGFGVELNPAAGTNLEFLVYEDTGGGLTQIASASGSATGGRAYYMSPSLGGLALTAGNDYVFGIHWTGGTAGYYWESLSVLPVATTWASHVEGLAYSGATTPTGAQLNTGQAYHMIVVPFEAETDTDVDGFLACAECDDTSALTFPGATEICDAIDNNCDGALPVPEQDGDGDGYIACQECDDSDQTAFPGGTEICDGVDNDCDGTVPANEIDGDGDGLAACSGDCDDNDPTSLPGAAEVCDGADNDCDGAALGLGYTSAVGINSAVGFTGAGNFFDVATSTAIDTVAMELDPSTGGFTGTWQIWNTTAGTSVLEASVVGTYPDSGRAMYESPSFSGWLLDAGNSYAIGVSWGTSNVQYWFTSNPTFPITTPFGTVTSGATGGGATAPGTLSSREWNIVIIGAPETDGDGDGFLACADCDDGDQFTFPGAAESCDGLDNDCDGVLPSNEVDGDGDGFGLCAGDCDDTNAATYSGATEICDGLDNDCNSTVPANEADNDNDGQRICAGDCGPNNATIYTGAAELCDGWDNDCDGNLGTAEVDGDSDNYFTCSYVATGGNAVYGGGDCADGNPAINPGAVEVCNGGVDDDCDASTQEGTDNDGDGESSCTDCNDNDIFINTSASEFCDGRDSNCDGVLPVDEQDPDSDGFIACAALDPNANPPSAVTGAGDCAANDATTYPGAAEVCDAIDNNCDGTVPANELDGDGDSFSACAGDCNDSAATSYPGATELCDGLDNDCNSTVPANEADNDGDGQRICDGDCNDANATILTGGTELCDGLDNDCSGTVPANEIDGDGDGEAVCEGDCDDANNAVFSTASEVCDGLDNDCSGAPGATETDGDSDNVLACAGDCDDNDATVAPGLPEICDGLDNNCNGSLPANESDNDGDSVRLCDGDCNDANATVYPGAVEACDGLDNDCSGTVPADETDDDGDGDNECADGDCDDTNATVFSGAVELCDGIDNDCNGAVPADETDDDGDGDDECNDGDCDDTDTSIYDGAPELCDALDNDCDGVVPADETDSDGDSSLACADCDDGNSTAFPANAEVCDGIDNDCDNSAAGEGDGDNDGDLACSDCDDNDAANYNGNGELCDGQDNDCNGSADLDTDGEVDADGDNELSCADCDDSDAANYFANSEVCDGQDNDCNGSADADAAGEVDIDGDSSLSCVDCDDSAAAAFPGNTEICDGQDNDCDGTANFGGNVELDADGDSSWSCLDCDDNDAANFPGGVEICDGQDNDCDGVVEQGQADADSDGQNVCDGDCDDNDAANFVGNAEICDGQDNDCSGDADFDAAGEVDADSDGSLSCVDCDDTNAAVLPGTPEVCDGLDTDCNGTADADAAGEVDADSDGSLSCVDCDDGDAANEPGGTELCDGQDNDCNGSADFDAAGEVDADGDQSLSCADCDDGDSAVFPGNPELCDGLDNDCDGVANAEGDEVDLDLDTALSCDDCDDDDDTVYPTAPELCDGLDNDCNELADFGGASDEIDDDGDLSFDCDDCDDTDPDSYPGAPELCDGIDNDCDGTDPATESADQDGDGFSVCEGDCDDTNPNSYDGATEICDGLDNDCDLTLPDGEIDADGDGFMACVDDCDDFNPLVSPDALEADSCDDGVDNDCDGDVDEADCEDPVSDDDDASDDDDDDSGADDDDGGGRGSRGGSDCACSAGPSGGAAWALLALLALLPRRRAVRR